MAKEAGVKKLVLVHVGPHLATPGPMERGIGDVRRIYSGEVIVADELMALRA
jgi:ribonuclease BN (tRNA processing enzyme)